MRDFTYTGKFREAQYRGQFFSADPRPGWRPDHTKAHAMDCPALTGAGDCRCKETQNSPKDISP